MAHVFLGIESEDFPMDGAAILVLDPSTAGPRFGYEAVRAAFTRGVARVPVMTQRLVKGPSLTPGYWTAYWAGDPEFDLDNHLARVTVSPPGDTAALGELCLRLSDGTLPRDRPLWRAWYVDGVAGGRAAVILRVHHAAVDGIAGMEMFGALLDLEPKPGAAEPSRDVARVEKPNGPGLLLRSLRDLATMPAEAAREAASLARALHAGGKAGAGQPRGRFLHDIHASPFDRRVSRPDKSLALLELPLADVKEVKDAFGVTLTDVILALVTASLRAYLLDRGEPVENALSALCPINVRAGAEHSGSGNHWATMFNRLPVQLADPIEQLTAIARETVANKRVAQATSEISNPTDAIADIVPPVAWPLLGKAMALPFARHVPPISNLQISSIPGSPQPLYLAGAKLLHLHSRTFVQQGSGLFIACVGYADSLDVGVTALRELVPDPERIAEGIERHLGVLRSIGPIAPPDVEGPRLASRRRSGGEARVQLGR
jgi:WS/DGAT/MGAT family acyltransferase